MKLEMELMIGQVWIVDFEWLTCSIRQGELTQEQVWTLADISSNSTF